MLDRKPQRSILVLGAVLIASLLVRGAVAADWVQDELLVSALANARGKARALLSTEGAWTKRAIGELGVEVIHVPPGRRDRLERDLRASRHFRFVERNYVASIDAVPDDPSYGEQWGLPVIQAPAAWDRARGAGVTIAVVDTGVDASHADLALVPGWNVLTGSSAAHDDNGHGTRMAGIAAAIGFNGLGVAGVAPEAQLMPIKALGASGFGTYADIAEGIVRAVDGGARVVNMSLGGSSPSAALSSAIEYAVSLNAVPVASSGNFGWSAPTYPAGYADTIAVGAVDDADLRASFSSYGSWLDMMAPGVGITTTNIGGGYGSSTGTSPAAPFVAGAAAVVLSANPALQAHQVASILAMTNDDLGAPGFDSQYGWGRLNLERAVEHAEMLAVTPDGGAPTVALLAPLEQETLFGVVDLEVEASDDVGVVRVEYELNGLVVASSAMEPFAASWDSQLTPPGPYLLSAVAYDASGNRGFSAPVTVQVDGNEVSCDTAGGACLPGGANPANDCLAEWFVVGDDLPDYGGREAPAVSCVDGAECDRDGNEDAACTFHVALCFAATDARLTTNKGVCVATSVNHFRLKTPRIRASSEGTDVANGTTLLSSVAALGAAQSEGRCVAGVKSLSCSDDADCDSLPGMSDGMCGLAETSLEGIIGADERCTALQPIRVPLKLRRGSWRKGRRTLKVVTTGHVAASSRARKDNDTLRLTCLPAS